MSICLINNNFDDIGTVSIGGIKVGTEAGTKGTILKQGIVQSLKLLNAEWNIWKNPELCMNE